MNTSPEIQKKYKKSFEHSYALGPFPLFELLYTRPEAALRVWMDEEFNDCDKLSQLCLEKGIAFSYSKKVLQRISDKEICFAAGAFQKYTDTLSVSCSHVVLVNPSDMGNIGTIFRTALGFGIHDIAVISPAADHFNPKCVRASMGAVFKLRVAVFDSFEEYQAQYSQNRSFFPFMLEGGQNLTMDSCPAVSVYSLIFGNEASGLSAEFQKTGTPFFIPQTDEVDSLNLSVAAGIGIYLFTQKNAGRNRT